MTTIPLSYRRWSAGTGAARRVVRGWTATDEARLRLLAGQGLPGGTIARLMRRTERGVRVKAARLGIAIGQRREGER